MTDKSVDQWVSEIEAEVAQEQVLEADLDQQTFTQELMDDRALFGRLFEHAGEGVAEKMQTLAKTGEVNTYSQVSMASQQQQQEQAMERD